MPVLDFREIPIASSGSSRDQFELFAREFLDYEGFKMITGPDRGPDAGRDLIVQETRNGIIGETLVRWLVSCKHKAHSGTSVTPSDEPDIHDRVRTHGCQGFIAFYSTIPSSGLAAKLNARPLPFEVTVYDGERIERSLLRCTTGLVLAKRFFPSSLSLWQKNHPVPAKVFSDEPVLLCHHCKKDLLRPKPSGVVVIWTSMPDANRGKREHTQRVYWCCKGQCDRVLRAAYMHEDFHDGWEDISDLVIPAIYIRWIMVTLNEFQRGMTYSDHALANTKALLLNLFPFVSREMTEAEKERFGMLSEIPSFLGGLGYES